ncbi:MAG: phosphocholine cytidylyltransferase family protein [Calditrichae bacterium]|nr:phosphocholine cytidylyltransferase family protein [Calditrichia bacterium]
MIGIILAAGVASRMRPLTNNTPKCLLPMGGKTILERAVNNLLANDIDDIIIVTGYLNNKIRDFIETAFPKIKITIIHNEIYDSTNNIYSLWLTKNHTLNHDMLLLDSDIVFDGRIIAQLKSSGYENSLALKSDHKLGDEEIKVTVAADRAVTEISKTVNPASAIGESVGIECFSKNFVNELFTILDEMIIMQKDVNVFYEKAFQRAIEQGQKIYPVDVQSYKCMEIDTIEDYEQAKKMITDL